MRSVQVSVFLGRGGFSFHPPQVLTGSEVYARYGSALAVLGDLDMDGFNGETPDQDPPADAGNRMVAVETGETTRSHTPTLTSPDLSPPLLQMWPSPPPMEAPTVTAWSTFIMAALRVLTLHLHR